MRNFVRGGTAGFAMVTLGVACSGSVAVSPSSTPAATSSVVATATPSIAPSATPTATSAATCYPASPPLALRVIYPEYNATSVPDDASVTVYAPTGAYGGSSPIPLALGIGTASPIALQPTSVPSPGPTPSEAPSAGATEYAAALPTLSPATEYTLYAILTYTNSCGVSSTTDSPINTFTTQ